MTTLVNQYILEAKYLDNIKRVKRKYLVGVFANLADVEKAKNNLISKETKYKLAFSLTTQFNPFLQRVA
jgi:hypothetical protein